MLPYQERVVQEQKELDRKLADLRIYIISSSYRSLPDDEKDRLFRQSQVMESYSQILGERIACFPKGDDSFKKIAEEAIADLVEADTPASVRLGTRLQARFERLVKSA